MCSKGGGSPPVPSAASTTFNSTVSPNPAVMPLYMDFLNRANTLSGTPFNPAMKGSVAPMSNEQTFAGTEMYHQGLDMGNFDPAKVTSIMSPFTEQVVGATQNWFNNQNAIQGNDLMSQAIRSGNAFGGDRAGVAEGVLAGQQQLAQAPVIAGLRQAGYTQALDEYNRLKVMGLQGAQAALGWGAMEQQQTQRELDVAQQNAMMESAYPFQTMNWYGSALGGIGPLTGQTAAGSNNPPTPNAAGQLVGAASAGAGLFDALGNFTGGGAAPAASSTSVPAPAWRGGSIHRARGGLVNDDSGEFGGREIRLPRGFAYGGDPSQDDREDDRYRERDDTSTSGRPDQPSYSTPSDQGARKIDVPNIFGQLRLPQRQLPQPVFPNTAGSTQPQKGEAEQWLDFGTKAVGLAAKAAPFFIKRGGGVGYFADGGSDDGDAGSILSDAGPDPILPGQQFARDYTGRTTWFNPRNERGGYTYTDESGQNWTDTGAQRLREGPHASGLPSTTRGFATPGSSDLGNWFEVNAPGGRRTYAQKTDIGPPGVVDLNAPLASSLYRSPNAMVGGTTYVRDLGRERPPGAGGTQWPDPSKGNVIPGQGLPSGEQPSTPAWQVPGARQGRGEVAGGPSDEDQRRPYDQPQNQGYRPGQIAHIPGLDRPAQTFGQRWASSPFTQFGAAMLAGKSPYLAQNLGEAMLKTGELQHRSRREDILDAKPEHITLPNGEQAFRIGGKIFNLGLGVPTSETRAADADRRARESHDRAITQPYKVGTEKGPGLFDEDRDVFETYDPATGQRKRHYPAGMQPQQTPQPETPLPPPEQPQPQQQPPAPPPTSQPAPPPQMRQTQGPTGSIAGDLNRPLEDRLAAAETAEKGTTAPPTTPTPSPTQQAQAPAPQTEAAGGPSIEHVENDWKTGRVAPAGTITNPKASMGDRNEAVLQGLSVGDQQYIKDIVDYKRSPTSIPPKHREKVMQYAQSYDPNYNQAMYDARKKALISYGASGPEARVLQSQDMVMRHINEGMNNAEKLAPYLHGYSWMNQAQTKQQEILLRDPKRQAILQATNAKYDAIATEAMRVFRGGVGAGSQREIQEWRANLDASQPIEKQRASLKAITELVEGRIGATAQRYNDIMGPAYERAPESWLGQKGRDALTRAKNMPDDGSRPFLPPGGGQEPARPGAPASQLSGQDQQALDWANRNPNDPRAGQIKQRLGVQ